MSPSAFRERLHKQFFAEYDRYLDTNRTRKWLADSRVAAVVEENLEHHDGVKYQLLAWCIMSNHVHVVLQPIELSIAGARSVSATSASESFDLPEGYFGDEVSDAFSPLSNILHSLKSYTANRANAILKRTGCFWQPESYDHWIRDLDELERVVAYVIHNPVKAGLCATPVEWRFSSAYVRHKRDGSTCGLVGRLRDDWHS
jgi:putative DNA methylase